ncbi:histidine phosphatase family protein, partial [Rhodobacteraceae bacterium 2CG4]
MTIILLRHGRTAWNRAGIVIGQRDVPLDAGGRHEAQECAFRRIRSAVPTTSGQSFRGIRSPE